MTTNSAKALSDDPQVNRRLTALARLLAEIDRNSAVRDTATNANN